MLITSFPSIFLGHPQNPPPSFPHGGKNVKNRLRRCAYLTGIFLRKFRMGVNSQNYNLAIELCQSDVAFLTTRGTKITNDQCIGRFSMA